MIKECIEKIVSKADLSYNEAYTVMNEIMNGSTSQVQNAAYLAALSTKSAKAETIAEISGSAAAMRDHALKVPHDMDILDIVGTGGDHAHSINISTTAAFIIAAAGINKTPATKFLASHPEEVHGYWFSALCRAASQYPCASSGCASLETSVDCSKKCEAAPFNLLTGPRIELSVPD